jgi:hypothetical protein
MDVGVDERGERVPAGRVEQLTVLGCGERSGRAELGDDAIADHDVVGLVEPGPRVDDVGAADEQLGRLALAVI